MTGSTVTLSQAEKLYSFRDQTEGGEAASVVAQQLCDVAETLSNLKTDGNEAAANVDLVDQQQEAVAVKEQPIVTQSKNSKKNKKSKAKKNNNKVEEFVSVEPEQVKLVETVSVPELIKEEEHLAVPEPIKEEEPVAVPELMELVEHVTLTELPKKNKKSKAKKNSKVEEFMSVPEQVKLIEPVSVPEPIKEEEFVAVPEPIKLEEPVTVVEQVKLIEPVSVPEQVISVESVSVPEPIKVEVPIAIVEQLELVEPVSVPEPIKFEEPVAIVEKVELIEPVSVVEPVKLADPVLEQPKALDGVAKTRDSVCKGMQSMSVGGEKVEEVVGRLAKCEAENTQLKSLLACLEARLVKLEGGKPAAAPVVAAAAPAAKKASEDDDDFDMFGDEEDDEEVAKRNAERVAAYQAKKALSNKPAVIAKSSILLDCKPWDDETNMKELEDKVRSIAQDGLVWGPSKLVPVAYGVKKLQIQCVIEDDKVSTEVLEEKILEFEDHCQSVDIAAFNKI